MSTIPLREIARYSVRRLAPFCKARTRMCWSVIRRADVLEEAIEAAKALPIGHGAVFDGRVKVWPVT